MKFSQILVLYLSLVVAPSALAVPLRFGDRCSSGSADVRCIGHKDDHGGVPNSRLSGVNTLPIHERQLSQTLKSILEGLPIIGPILAPLLGSLLGAIGLSELDVGSASNGSLNVEQIAALANFEFALSNAVHKVLSDGSPGGGAQAKLKARGVVPLGELTTGVPMIGPFLRPLVSLLEALNLDSVDTKQNSVFSLALLTEDQSTKLVHFQTILRQEIAKVLPSDASDPTPPDVPSPSKASPDDTKPSQTPSPNTSDDDGSDSDTPSPDDASPADEPTSTPVSSPGPK